MSSCEIIEGITLHHGDCRDIMRALPADHFDAIITDPPYGLAFKGEKWDTATPRSRQRSTRAHLTTDGRFSDISRRPRHTSARRWGGQHAIVKPLELMRYLIRLVVRPGALIFEPFAGSGTTLQAAAMEGVSAVGCELDKRYIPLIHERFRCGIDAPLDILI